MALAAFCRDCDSAADAAATRCAACGSHRIARHAELGSLAIAHVDCDAFYASVEKRDRPELAARPVIVGGARRGVVSAACYVARMHGVRSAMPMFKALKLAPDAVVIKPDMAKYVAAARQVRALMETLTPLVQPLSIDEAVLDLSGTEALHAAPPAIVAARLARAIELQVGVTASIGLSWNRLLAKIAADRDKPRGFCAIGRADALAVLAPEPVSLLPGVGPAMAASLARRGFSTLGQLQALSPRDAARLLGEDGVALCARARGEDARIVDPSRDTRSISAEATFDTDLADAPALSRVLWRLCEKLAQRLREKGFAASGVVLKLKTSDFRPRTRNTRLPVPTLSAETLFQAGRVLLEREVDGVTHFRLIGIGAAPLAAPADADHGDLADPAAPRRVAAEAAVQKIREKFGRGVIGKGRGL